MQLESALRCHFDQSFCSVKHHLIASRVWVKVCTKQTFCPKPLKPCVAINGLLSSSSKDVRLGLILLWNMGIFVQENLHH